VAIRDTATHVRLGAPLGVAALAGGACVAIWLGDPTTARGWLPVCPTKMLLGISCPGCGSLRMMYSLLHGDISAAVHYNAVALAALGLLLWAYGAWVYGRLVGRRIRSWQHHRCSVATTLAVVAVWFVVRNLPFEPFRSLHV
jgi:Protein of unknown function (DUF2752)